LEEAPDILSETIIALVSHEYWKLNSKTDSNEKFARKRELFCNRFENFFMKFVDKVEQRGKWDMKMERAYGMYLQCILQKKIPAAKSFRNAFQNDGDIEAIVPYAQILLEKKRLKIAK
jgi:hypothetical protein